MRKRELQRLTAEIVPAFAERKGTRILHVTDFHNRPAGFAFAQSLGDALNPDVVVCTGDLSGIGGFPERMLLQAFFPTFTCPLVYAPGNHDSKATSLWMTRHSAAVLDTPKIVDLAGLKIWGYPDPNISKLFGKPYSPALCRSVAASTVFPTDAGPLVAALHNELMLPPGASPTVLLSGHFHSRRADLSGSTLRVRGGSAGGGGPFGGPLDAAVIEVEQATQMPLSVTFVEVSRHGVSASRVFP